MSRLRVRLLIGLVVAVALAWGATLDLTAAKAAAKNATARAAAAVNPAPVPTPATKAPAKAARRATTTVATVLPSEPFPGTEAAMAGAGAPQQGKAKKSGPATRDQVYVDKFKRVAPSQQKQAAKNAAALGMKLGVAGVTTTATGTSVGIAAAAGPLPGIEGPGGTPHYFGPYANWAFSPMPSFGLLSTVAVVSGGAGYVDPIVTITDIYGTGTATATPTLAAGGVIQAIAVNQPTSGFHVPFVSIVDNPATCGAAPLPPCGTGAAATASIDPTTLAGGMKKFVDLLPGIPGVTPYNTVANGYNGDGSNKLGQYLTLATADQATYPGSDYYEIALVEYMEQMHSALPPTRLRGYVQLSATGTPLVNPPAADGTPGTPILLPNGTQAKAVDKPHYLGPIILAQGKVAGLPQKDANGNPTANAPRPVRIKFYNLLPAGAGGDLLLPVDETVPGSGVGPSVPGSAPGAKYTQNRATIHLHGNNTVWISDGNTHQWITPADEATPYPKGVSARNVPDMFDGAGNVDCEVAPAGKTSSGCLTFYYTNAQSARLQFYHDHAHGITRLNVYAGEAAGYVVTDAVEQDLIDGTNFTGVNINPDGTPCALGSTTCAKVLPDIGIPLVIQDKTWVDANTVFAQDPTWNSGSGPRDPLTGNITGAVDGDFWYPHVYMTVTNPWDPTGTNAFGRWFYGPWFNPPTPVCVNGGPVGCIENGPVPNPYYQPICDGLPDPVNAKCTAPWEPPLNPGMPTPSIPGESFLDTPTVNGTAYPVLKLEPKPYRFRILNAANDRAQNLQLYVAADKNSPTTPGAAGTVLCNPTPADPTVCTEVKMVPVSIAPANQYADTPSGIPDPATKGPDWWQIGTEGGFTPAPVVIPQQPIGYNLDPAYFNFGIVNQHSLFLMAAERADVIVDFSQYAGKTLILYNDSPAPVPAGAAPYDFYTGMGDQTGGGGAPDTQPGYGPNTRTIMQIQVGTSVDPNAPNTDVKLANLEAVFKKSGAKRGVFELSQDPIIIPQAAYGSAYEDQNKFPANASQYILNIGDTQKNFQPLGYDGTNWSLQPAVTIPFEMKAMHDEMGGVYDTGFGRMSGMLGLTNPSSALGFILPFPFSSPPTDVVQGSLETTKIGQLADGTQIWRIFHNGVDTHPIHTHLFTAQVISRVGQDGQVAPGPFPSGQAVDAQNVGWKDTFYVNPLEITFLALRPTVPTPSEIPFELPDSVRLIDPTLPDGATLPPPGPAGWFDPNGVAIPEILNHTVNFGWEYVWHCHILSHEEMDFMHSLVFSVPPRAATNLAAAFRLQGNQPQIVVNFTDQSFKELGFTIERATNATFTSGLVSFTLPAAVNPVPFSPVGVSFTDTTGITSGTTYYYRVWANGPTVGDVSMAPAFPTMAARSLATNCTPPTPCPTPATVVSATVGTAATSVASPTNLTRAVQAGPQVSLTWRDNATNESGFVVERCTVTATVTCAAAANYAAIATPGPRNNTGNVTYVDTTVAYGNTYFYRVKAVVGSISSLAYAPTTGGVQAIVPGIPAAPANFKATVASNKVTVSWTMSSTTNLANFTLQRAENLAFTTGLSATTLTAATTTVTQTVTRGKVYYYRIKANNSIGGSTAWVNALPFPILVP